MPTTLQDRLERLFRATLIVFVLLAAAFLSAITAMRIAIRGRVETMPNLVGKSLKTAQQTMNARHLSLRVDDRLYDALPAGSVIRQRPEPGGQIKIGQDGQVVVSLGPQSAFVPNVEGRSVRLARIAVAEAGLQLGEISTIEWPTSDADTVIKQTPPAGAKAASPRVDLLVAAEIIPTAYVMPPVTGLDQADAAKILSGAGLPIAKRTFISDSGAPKGTVIGQTPPAGNRIDDTAQVELGIAN